MTKLGILGYGYIAKIHLENINKLSNTKVNSIFSTIDERENILEDINFYMDYEKMILQEQLDAVLICTPTFTHEKIACDCAKQGIKNIFLEKPMALTLEECNSILDTVKEYKTKLLVGHVLRFWPTYGSVQKHITNSNSQIGEPRSIIAKRLGTFPWSKWFADQRKSGGVILDLSIHDIDYALWLLGRPTSIISEAKEIKKHNMLVMGESTTNINFKDGKTAECEASWAKPADFQFYTHTKIEGTKNAIELDGDNIFNNDLLKIQNIYNSNDGYFNLMKHFVDGITNDNQKFMVSGEEGKKTVKVCLGAIKSAMNNGKEIFVDNLE